MGINPERFNDQKFIYNTEGGPVFNTQVVTTNGGREQRASVWEFPLGEWQFTQRLIREDEKDYILDFFIAHMGRQIPFLFKDWANYQTKGAGVINTSGAGNAGGDGQLFKRFAVGQNCAFQKITRPVDGTVELFIDGSPLNASVDVSTGVVIIAPTLKNITAAAANGPSTFLLTIPNHGIQSGDVVEINLGSGAWSGLSGRKTATVNDANTVQFPGAATGLPTFAPGANTKMTWYPQPRNALTWSGEFDFFARFDEDHITMEFHGANVITNGVLGEKFFNFAGVKIKQVKE